jgi:hypothetical protein
MEEPGGRTDARELALGRTQRGFAAEMQVLSPGLQGTGGAGLHLYDGAFVQGLIGGPGVPLA